MGWLAGLLGWFGRTGGGGTQPRPRLAARYDSAQQNVDHQRYWANAVLESPTAANTPGVRQTLRNRSRYEYENNGYCSGMVRSRADDLVNTGPTLQIVSDDDALASAVEKRFAAWAKAVYLGETLHTMDQARCRDGEAFAVLRTNPGVNDPVQLDVHAVEADRVAPPWGTLFPISPAPVTEGQYFDGVYYDPYGNPTAYSILRQHPGDLIQVFPRPHDVVPAKYVLHWFRRDRPGQLRGVPEITSSLGIFAYLRRWTLANLSAAEVAATMGGGMLQSVAPADPDTVEPSPFAAVDIERGMLTELPAGFEFKQLTAQFPQTTYADFKREILVEAGRPIRQPANISTGDSSRYNYSSAKLDHYCYRGAIKVDRCAANCRVLDKIFYAWLEEALLIPDYLPAGLDPSLLQPSWYWPGWPSMDKDEAKNTTEQLHNGTTTLAAELAEEGKDWRETVVQMGKEAQFREENGVPLPQAGGGASPPGGASPAVAPPANGFHRNGTGVN